MLKSKPLFLLLLLLCFGLLLSPAAGIQLQGEQSPTEIDILEAIDKGMISYVARGRGVASGAMIELTVTNLIGEPLQLIIQPGTLFIPTNAATVDAPASDHLVSNILSDTVQLSVPADGQNIFSAAYQGGQGGGGGGGVYCSFCPPRADDPEARPQHVAQTPHTDTFIVEAYCINAHLPNPTADTLYEIRPAGGDDLTRLLQHIDSRGGSSSVIATQIATWIITDDVDLDFLEEVGYGPSDAELREALLLLRDAGIDISDKLMGSVEIPPAPPEIPAFSPGVTTAITVRGTVVTAEGESVESAFVTITANGPDNRQVRFDLTSSRGRFEGTVNLFESDTVAMAVFALGRRVGALAFSARELYDFFKDGSEIVITLSSPSAPPPEPQPGDQPGPAPEITEPDAAPEPTEEAAPPLEPGVTLLNPPLYGLHLNPDRGNVRDKPTTSGSTVTRTLGCGGPVVALDAFIETSSGKWYRLESGGWVFETIVTVYDSKERADEVSRNSGSICNPSVPPPQTTPQDPSQPPPDDPAQPPGGGETDPGEEQGPPPTPIPTATFPVTNNLSCNLSGNFGPVFVNLGPSQSTNVTLAYGSYSVELDAPDCVPPIYVSQTVVIDETTGGFVLNP